MTPTHKSPAKWEYYIQNQKLSQNEKVNLIQEDIKSIEERAMRKEKLIEQNVMPGHGYGIEYQNNEVNDMLIDAIKAKLAMLDEMK